MKLPYGFYLTDDSAVAIDREKADTVRLIYRQYLSGMSLDGIADLLYEQNNPSPKGKERWTQAVVNAILSKPDIFDLRQKHIQQLIDQNARVAQNQDDYQRRYDEMFARYEDAEKALTTAQGSLRQKEKQTEQIESFITEVESLPDSVSEFRTDYWGHLVEKVTVHRKGTMTFSFACGVEIQI